MNDYITPEEERELTKQYLAGELRKIHFELRLQSVVFIVCATMIFITETTIGAYCYGMGIGWAAYSIYCGFNELRDMQNVVEEYGYLYD